MHIFYLNKQCESGTFKKGQWADSDTSVVFWTETGTLNHLGLRIQISPTALVHPHNDPRSGLPRCTNLRSHVKHNLGKFDILARAHTTACIYSTTVPYDGRVLSSNATVPISAPTEQPIFQRLLSAFWARGLRLASFHHQVITWIFKSLHIKSG